MSTVHVVDLIYLIAEDRRTLTAVVVVGDGEPEMVGPVPATGGTGELARLLADRFPGHFAAPEDIAPLLAARHVLNMTRRENAAGQPYPFRMSDLDAG